MHHMLGHASVNLARQLDKTRVLIELACLPSQVKWVDRNTVAPEAWARIKRHEPERLGLGSFYNLPDINTHCAINQFQLVHQRDVNTAEDVLEQFGCFGNATR